MSQGEPQAVEPQAPGRWQRSETKLLVRSGILAVFGTIFGLAINRDINSGVFPWWMALGVFLACLPLGYLLRKLVPMEFHPASLHVTVTFDKVYLSIIVPLVLIKALAGNVFRLSLIADVVMCVILGLMLGRLAGIAGRARSMKRG